MGFTKEEAQEFYKDAVLVRCIIDDKVYKINTSTIHVANTKSIFCYGKMYDLYSNKIIRDEQHLVNLYADHNGSYASIIRKISDKTFDEKVVYLLYKYNPIVYLTEELIPKMIERLKYIYNEFVREETPLEKQLKDWKKKTKK